MLSQDFTRLQETLKSVSDPVEFLVSMFAYAPIGFAIWKLDGHLLLTNQAFLDLFGSVPPPDYNILEDDVVAETSIPALIKRAFAGEITHIPTFWYNPRDLKNVTVTQGNRVAISMSIFPVLNQQGAIEFVAAAYRDETDITMTREILEAEGEHLRDVITDMEREAAERQRAEQAVIELNRVLEDRVRERTAELEAINKELETFSYSVSHDLRAPLRAIDGFGQILVEDYHDQLDADGQDHLRRIRGASQRMGELIDDLLMLSRVTRTEMTRSQVDLSALARQVADELCRTQPQREVEFVIMPGLIVNADANLMQIVLENLLGNAMKYTGKHPLARIEFGEKQQEGQSVWFVADDGAGFDVAYAGKLFGPFQRLHRESDFEGTGIGLATVQRIIYRHGGRIWAEAAVEQGATFYFTLSS